MRTKNLSSFLELDVQSLHEHLSDTSAASGGFILGPSENLFGSLRHEFMKINESIILQIQNFNFKEPYTLRTLRPGFVVFQITKSGSYYRTISENTDQIATASLSVTNYPDTTTFVSAQDQRLEGVALFIEREFLLDGMGLVVDGLRDPHRSIFTSPLGSPTSLHLPLPAKVWMSADDVLKCELQEPTRTKYLQSKALEILYLSIDYINSYNSILQKPLMSVDNKRMQQVQAIASIYKKELNNIPSIHELSERLDLNRNLIIDLFSKQFGMTPHRYALQLRMERAFSQIKEAKISFTSIAANVGYKNYAAFSRAYADYFGFPPSDTQSDVTTDVSDDDIT